MLSDARLWRRALNPVSQVISLFLYRGQQKKNCFLKPTFTAFILKVNKLHQLLNMVQSTRIVAEDGNLCQVTQRSDQCSMNHINIFVNRSCMHTAEIPQDILTCRLPILL